MTDEAGAKQRKPGCVGHGRLYLPWTSSSDALEAQASTPAAIFPIAGSPRIIIPDNGINELLLQSY